MPVNRSTLYIDIFARWALPIILCSRTTLGTINHSLLSLEAIRRRELNVLGIVFISDENLGTENTICNLGKVRRLGRLPHLPTLTREALRVVFARSFAREVFLP
jgi:dethiobiotin synthetase